MATTYEQQTTYAPISPQAVMKDRPERPRAVSTMSYASTAKSHKSSRSKEEKKLDLVESAKDKRRLEGKADPTKALHEAQPSMLTIKSTASSLIILQPM